MTSDDWSVYRYHGQFIAVARHRYLGATENHRRDIHATLAHYYLGTWSRGRRKPFRYSKKQLRCVSATGRKGKQRKLEDEADRLVTAASMFTFTFIFTLGAPPNADAVYVWLNGQPQYDQRSEKPLSGSCEPRKIG